MFNLKYPNLPILVGFLQLRNKIKSKVIVLCIIAVMYSESSDVDTIARVCSTLTIFYSFYHWISNNNSSNIWFVVSIIRDNVSSMFYSLL